MRTTFTTMLTDAQAGRLESILEGKGFGRREVPYARFSFAGPSLLVTVYEKKNKLLLQGKGTDDFIEFTLEPQVTGLLSLQEEAEEDEGVREPISALMRAARGIISALWWWPVFMRTGA